MWKDAKFNILVFVLNLQACSFILSNPELLNYDEFYEAVESLLFAGSRRAVDLTDDRVGTMVCFSYLSTFSCHLIVNNSCSASFCPGNLRLDLAHVVGHVVGGDLTQILRKAI